MNYNVKPFYLDVSKNDRLRLHDALDEILDSGNLILGDKTSEFEKRFADFTGSKCGVSFNSATSALEVQLRLENVADRKVAVPTNTNFATVAAIIHARGVPVFLDMDVATFAPSLEQVSEAHARYPDLAGVLWVHIGGVISPDVPDVANYCHSHGLFFLEDCAHAHGSVFRGRHAGTFGRSGAYSFFPTKVMTTMEGGMIITDREEDIDFLKSMRNQGKRAGNYNALHMDLGSSWRMSEFSAALGLLQLERLPTMIQLRAKVAESYVKAFDKIGLQYVHIKHMESASNYKFIGLLPDGVDYQVFKKTLLSQGIILGGSVYDIPCHKQPVFRNYLDGQESLPVSEHYCGRQFCLPITSGMSEAEIAHVVHVVSQVLG